MQGRQRAFLCEMGTGTRSVTERFWLLALVVGTLGVLVGVLVLVGGAVGGPGGRAVIGLVVGLVGRFVLALILAVIAAVFHGWLLLSDSKKRKRTGRWLCL